MMVDSSALVAILTEEADGEELAIAIDRTVRGFTSPLALFETVASIRRKLNIDVEEARDLVASFLGHANITIEPIDQTDGDLALSAFARYGKGRGHPAQLNLGACFAYAMAKARDVPLLYKGEDFARTDVRDARRA
jgi:ribonuclease VapC